MKEYSLYGLLNKLYEAKRLYYGTGKSGMTDQEYDALEGSIKAIHGEELYKEWNCVGYDAKKHLTIKESFKKIQKKEMDEFNRREVNDK